MVIVSVRGMGVAVMTRTSGAGSREVSLARCATPNLCCSSITARPRCAKCHAFIEQRMRADDDLGGGIVVRLRTAALPGSARVTRAGFGVSPKRTFP